MKLLLFSLICLIPFINMKGKSFGEIPPWVKGELPPKGNDSYFYMVSEGFGTTIKDAQKDADLSLVSNLMRSKGVNVSGIQIEKMLLNSQNGNAHETIESDYQYSFTHDKVTLSFRAVDTYWIKKNSRIEIMILYEVANNPMHVEYEPVEYTKSYGARGFWRSALIPGWGQMYKKQFFKGSVFLIGEAALITSIIVYENQRSAYIQKAVVNSDINAIKFYQNKATKSKNIRNGLIGGAAALYVYNIIDALVAKGKLRYVKPTDNHLTIEPYCSSNFDFGLYLTYTF